MLSVFDWLQKLLGREGSSDDGMKQSEREAFVRLIVYAMYADRSISLSEDRILNREIGSLCWQGALTVEDFLNRAIAQARDIPRHSSEEQVFIEECADSLLSPAARQRARDIVEAITMADGDEDRDERKLKEQLRAALGGM